QRRKLDAARGGEDSLPQRSRLAGRFLVDLARPLLQRRHVRTPSVQKIAYQSDASSRRAHSRRRGSTSSSRPAPASAPRALSSTPARFSTNAENDGSPAQAPKKMS